MIFNIPYVYDMEQICLQKQKLINQAKIWENKKCLKHDYSFIDKVSIVKEDKF